MAYDIVPYDRALKEQIADIQRHLWRGDAKTNIAYLEWKYERNPFWETPLIYLAVTDRRVVGMRGMFGSAWEIGGGGEMFAIPCADDFVIVPEHRNRGLSSLIMRTALDDMARRGHAYLFTLSPGPVTLATSLIHGWRAVGAMRPVHRRRRAGLLQRAYSRLDRIPVVWRLDALRSRWAPSRGSFRRLDRRGSCARPGRSGQICVEREPRISAMAELVRRLGYDGRIRHVRDERYLAWRFQNPLHEYRFLVFCDNDGLGGYLVLQAHRRDRSRGVHIADWEGTTRRIRSDLLRAAVEWGDFAELSIWTATLSGEARELLSAAAFVPAPVRTSLYSPNVLALSTRPGHPDPSVAGRRLMDIGEWDIRMLYSMAG